MLELPSITAILFYYRDTAVAIFLKKTYLDFKE